MQNMVTMFGFNGLGSITEDMITNRSGMVTRRWIDLLGDSMVMDIMRGHGMES